MAFRRATLFCLVLLVSGWLVSLSCAPGEQARQVSLRRTERGLNVLPPPPGTLRIAVSAMVSPRETLSVYGEMIDYIGQRLGRPVALVQRKTYAQVNQLIETAEVDMAFICTRAYVEGHRDFGMELLAVPKVQGKTVYHAYLIVPEDSPITSFEQLRGKSFAFTDPLSNTGKLVPTYMLARMGETPDSFFSSYVYTYSHTNSIKWVARKLVDGASVDSLVWDYAEATDPEFTRHTKIIQVSPPYASPPVVVGPGLDPALKEGLRAILLGMDQEEWGRQIMRKVMLDEFVPLEDRAYDSVREMLRFLEGGG